MVLMNYIELVTDVPKSMHFTDHTLMSRTIWDKELNREKVVDSHVFVVDWEDGDITWRTFSVLSTNLSRQLAAYLPDNRFRDFVFTITRRGEGFVARYEVEAEPLPPDFPI